MSTLSLFSIATELWGALNSAFLLIFIISNKRKDDDSRHVKILLPCVCIALMLFDASAYFFQGKATSAYHFFSRFSSFGVYFINYIFMSVFGHFLWDNVKNKGEKNPARLLTIYALTIIGIIVLVISQWCDLLYYFDDMNVYHRGKFFLVGQAIALIGVFISLTIFIQYRSRLKKNVFVAMLSYFVLPLLGAVLTIFFYGFAFQNLASVIASQFIILVEFINYQEMVSKIKLKEAEKQKELELAAIELQKANLAKAEFLSHMSHDIRTPLNGIIGLLDIEDKNENNIEMLSELRSKERVAANHLLSLINDVLNMTKLDEGKIELENESTNIIDVVEETITINEIKANENGVSFIKNDLNVTYPNVFCSPVHLRQVLVNIISNSIKYNKENGTIECSIKENVLDDERVEYTFIIKDSGIGMSEEYMKKLFEPFSQERQNARSRYQGTGLGMAITKKLVEVMNGKISVESEEGVGTTFFVTIPFKIDKNAKERKEIDEEKVSIKNIKILLVEDNELNIEIAQYLLEDEGAIVTVAKDGKEAVDIFKESKPGTFDMILMDIMMPRMNGYEATKEIRLLDREDATLIPIIAMSANAFSEDIKKSKESGMNDHISKPIDLPVLLKTISRFVI